MKTVLKAGVSSLGIIPGWGRPVDPSIARFGRSMGKTTSSIALALKQALR